MPAIDAIKDLDANYGIGGYPKPPYDDDHPALVTRRANINKLTSTIDELSEQFRVHLIDDLGHDAALALDCSVESLKVLDGHFYRRDYPNFFKKEYLTDDFAPLLWAYISKSMFACIAPVEGSRRIDWKYSSSVKKHVIQPNSGGRVFSPYQYAELVIFSGFRLHDFYKVIHDYCYSNEIHNKTMVALLGE